MCIGTRASRRASPIAVTTTPFLTLLATLFAMLLLTCASTPGSLPGGDPAYPFPVEEEYRLEPLSEAQRMIIAGGPTLVGTKALTVLGATYPNDCTGLVRAAYAFASIDLAYHFSRYSGNGVKRLYQTLKEEALLYSVLYPLPGDLIFWNDTYDANGNGLADDELTHVGVVMSVQPDGSIRYLHYNYRLGPVIDSMNLLRPDIASSDAEGTVNSLLRMKGSPEYSRTNAAQLFRVFGKGYDLKTP